MNEIIATYHNVDKLEVIDDAGRVMCRIAPASGAQLTVKVRVEPERIEG